MSTDQCFRAIERYRGVDIYFERVRAITPSGGSMKYRCTVDLLTLSAVTRAELRAKIDAALASQSLSTAQ
jgi:hypothetical protein